MTAKPLHAEFALYAHRHGLSRFEIDELDLGVGQRAAHGGHAGFEAVVGGRHHGHRRALRLAVADGHLAAVHLVRRAPHQVDGAGGAGHDAGAQRAQIELGEARMLELRDEHGGHAVKRRAALLLHGFERGERVELRRGENQRGARCQRRHDPDHAAETVVERHGRADAVALGGFQPLADEQSVVDQVAVGQKHALRRAGCAGGVLDIDHVLGGRGHGRELHAAGQHALPLVAFEQDGRFQRQVPAVPRLVENLHVVGAAVLLVQEQQPHAGAIEDEAQVVGTVGGIGVDQDAPMRAAAACKYTHSAQMVDHIPMRSPGRMPSPHRPRAVRATSSWSWR